MRLDDKEIMLLWEQGVLRSSRSTPTKLISKNKKPVIRKICRFFNF